MRKEKGFTLVELAVAIGIMSTIITVSIYLYRDYSDREVSVNTVEELREVDSLLSSLSISLRNIDKSLKIPIDRQLNYLRNTYLMRDYLDNSFNAVFDDIIPPIITNKNNYVFNYTIGNSDTMSYNGQTVNITDGVLMSITVSFKTNRQCQMAKTLLGSIKVDSSSCNSNNNLIYLLNNGSGYPVAIVN